MAESEGAGFRQLAELVRRLVAVDGPSSPHGDLLRRSRGGRPNAAEVERVRRILDMDPAFRARVLAAASPEMIGAEAYAWLVDPSQTSATDRRRQAAEAARNRAENELERCRDEVDRLQRALADRESDLDTARRDGDAQQHRLDELERERDRLLADRDALRAEITRQQAAWEQTRLQLQQRLDDLAAVRDGLIAQRVDLDERLADLTSDLAGRERQRRDRRTPPPAQRSPLAVPGGLLSDSIAAAIHVLDRPDVVVIIDGYNAVLGPWTQGHLSQRRAVLLTALDAFISHRGPRVLVVFDGSADAAGGGERRLSRIVYSPPGVIADDTVCAEVQSLPTSSSVVVVTDDQDLIRRVRRLGANTVSVAQLWGVLRA
jgi:predicted RNA-binding protein with PIN domain